MNPQDILDSFTGDGDLALVQHTIAQVREAYDYRTLQLESAQSQLAALQAELKIYRAAR